MTLEELSNELLNLGVRKDAYSLEGGLPSEAYCINRLKDHWEIYYSERGLKSGLQIFKSENEACKTFLDLIARDTSTR